MEKSLKWKIAQNTELIWWKQYLSKKDKTEYIQWKKGYWQKILVDLKPVVKLNSGSRVLDAGCGPAGIFMALQKCRVDALDPLLDKYQENLKHFQKEDYPEVEFITVSMEDYRVAKDYDVVFCMNAINHVSRIGESLENIISPLKERGRLIITIDAHNLNFFCSLFRAIPGDILHPHQYTLSGYTKLIEGFGVRKIFQKKLKSGILFDHYMMVFEKA